MFVPNILLTMYLHSGIADQIYSFVVCLVTFVLIELSLTIDILSCVFLCCDVLLLFQKKGEGYVPLIRLIPLQMFAPVLRQESDVQ